MSKSLLKLLLLVASVTMYMMVIKPIWSGAGGILQPAHSVQSLRVMNVQYDDTLKQAESIIAQADTMRTQYAKVTEEDKVKMSVMVPDSIDKVRLLSEVQGIAEDAGFALNDIVYSEGNTSSTSKGSVYISFSTKTTYSRFKELMNNFEKSLRLFSISSITFNIPEKESELINFQVKLETYFMK